MIALLNILCYFISWLAFYFLLPGIIWLWRQNVQAAANEAVRGDTWRKDWRRVKRWFKALK